MLRPAWQKRSWVEARGLNLLARRRVLWDYLAGAMRVLPTVSVVVFLAAEVLLSCASYWMMPP